MASPKRPASYQDVLDAPPNMVAEILNGELVLSPRPAAPHTSVHSTLHAELGSPFGRGRGGPGGWILLIEPELHLGTDVVVPDLGGWRRTRMPAVPSQAYFTLAPDWICEVLSKSTEKTDRARKLAIYARAGVSHAWLRTLEVLRLHEGRWLTLAVHCDDERVRAEPFDAIELELGVLWQDLAPEPPTHAAEPSAFYDVY
jgi:Uma2 family endonuclease